MKIKKYKLCFLLSIMVFAISLYAPALIQAGKVPGWQLLLMGWLGVMEKNFTWFANFFYLFAVIFMLCYIPWESLILAVIGALLAGHFMFIYKQISLNEGGAYDIESLSIGYFAWLLSFVLLAATAILKIKDNTE